jgi:hypothetical protein
MINRFLGAWPGRVRQREIGRQENMIGADVIREGRDGIVPGVEEALALEHLQRRKVVTFTRETVVFELKDKRGQATFPVYGCKKNQPVPFVSPIFNGLAKSQSRNGHR